MATGADVLKMIKDNEVKFVDLRFTDTRGKEQHVSVPQHQFGADKFESGHAFDGSSIAGWKGIEASDMLLMSDGVEALGWHQMVAELQINGLAKELAQHCELRNISESEFVLRISPAQGHLQMKPAPDKLRQALSDYLGRAITLRFELAQTESETPAATVGRERLQRQELAVASIEDSFVRDVIESCDASLVESSLKPIE